MSASLLCHRDALTIAAHSTCPSSNWHTRIAPLILSPEMVMLNVGANKGFNLLEFAQRYSVTPSNLTHQRWYNLLVENGCKSQCCGVCRLCKARPISRQATASLKLHAFELQPANAALLRRMMTATGLPVMIHSTAVSNFTGTVYTAATVVAGSESFGLKHKQSKNDVAQPVTTIDAFLKTTGIERVHLVSIDTEGTYNRPRVLAHPNLCCSALSSDHVASHQSPAPVAGEDPLVMMGMVQALSAHRVEVVEFEYNRKWKVTMKDPRPVGPFVEWMRQLGYTCFWQGNHGALAQMSAPCFVEETRTRFGFARSNGVCAYREDVVAAFRDCQRTSSCSS